jgi:hypothetical protein
VAELPVGVVSEVEVETLKDILDESLTDTDEDSPGATLEDALVETSVARIDDVLVRDPVVKLLVSPMVIDNEVMSELVSVELVTTGKPSAPVLSGI